MREAADYADKTWLAAEATRSDLESRRRQEGMTVGGIVVFGGLGGLVLYDWTQGMAWARALVALVYQVGPL